jgi:riboflavin kinase
VRGCIARKKGGKRQRIAIMMLGLLLFDFKSMDCKNFPDGSRSDVLRGRVVSGLGEGQHYISRQGYLKQFREKLGFEPFPGTLNIKLYRHAAKRSRSRASLTRAEPLANASATG